MAHPLMHERIWFDKYKVDDAEKNYQEHRAKQVDGLVVQVQGDWQILPMMWLFFSMGVVPEDHGNW